MVAQGNERQDVYKYFIKINLKFLHPQRVEILPVTFDQLIIIVIITWPTEKLPQKNNSDITVFRVTDWLKWLNLFKISSLMSQFSTNKRT